MSFFRLYAEYFLPGIITPESFLKEIRMVAENELADRIYQPTFDPGWREREEYEKLAGFGLIYLAESMAGYGDFKRENELNTDLIN